MADVSSVRLMFWGEGLAIGLAVGLGKGDGDPVGNGKPLESGDGLGEGLTKGEGLEPSVEPVPRLEDFTDTVGTLMVSGACPQF